MALEGLFRRLHVVVLTATIQPEEQDAVRISYATHAGSLSASIAIGGFAATVSGGAEQPAREQVAGKRKEYQLAAKRATRGHGPQKEGQAAGVWLQADEQKR